MTEGSLINQRLFFFFFFFLKNFWEHCHKKRFHEIAFAVISQQPSSLTWRHSERSQDRDEPTAQEDRQHHPSWGRLLGASYERSQKLWEPFSARQSPSHPCASPTPADSASQLPCEVGNSSSCSRRRRKWGIRRLSCSPGVPQELCGKAEDEFNPLVWSRGSLSLLFA